MIQRNSHNTLIALLATSSVFTQMHVLGDYTKKRKEEDGVTVVLLPVSLPALKDAINGIYKEGLDMAYDRTLRPNHADELREMVQDPKQKVELVFFLDAYDELATGAALWKNLWRTNNLEQYGAHAGGDADGGEEETKGGDGNNPEQNTTSYRYPKVIAATTSACHPSSATELQNTGHRHHHFHHHHLHPKVLITVRSEDLSGQPDYRRSFLPLESQNEDRNDEKKAGKFFQELRFVPFGNRRKEYQLQHVALEWRDLFGKEVAPKLLEQPTSRALLVENELKESLGELNGLAMEREIVQDIFVETFEACSVVQAKGKSSTADANRKGSNLASSASRWFQFLHKTSSDVVVDSENWDRAVSRTAMLAAAAQLDSSKDESAVVQFLRKHTASGDDQTWTAHHYDEEFKKIPELDELTTTPFMVKVRQGWWWVGGCDTPFPHYCSRKLIASTLLQIVTNILPRLSGQAREVSEIKSGLVVRLGEAVADVAWAALKEVREDVAKLVGGEASKGEENEKDGEDTVLGRLQALQMALDADSKDEVRGKWLKVIKTIAQDMTTRVEAMVEKNPAEWDKDGALPEGCEISGQRGVPANAGWSTGDADGVAQGSGEASTDGAAAGAKQLVGTPWSRKLAGVVERALMRTLRRQPTQRADIYDEFVDLWLDREIR